MITEFLSYLLYGVSVARYKEYAGPLGHQLLRYGSSQPATSTSNHQRFALETQHYPACLLTKDADRKILILPPYSTRCRSRPFRHTYGQHMLAVKHFRGVRLGVEMVDGAGVQEQVRLKVQNKLS